MTDLDELRKSMDVLSSRLRKVLALEDAGAGHCELVDEMHAFMLKATTALLDLADRAVVLGDHELADELYEAALEIEGQILEDGNVL